MPKPEPVKSKPKPKKNRWGMTKAENRVWAMACRQARRNFDLKSTPGARPSYAAGFYSCYMYLKSKGLLKEGK